MSISTLLRAGLIGDSGVGALVSTRIYPDDLPQKPTYPAITYQRISNSGQNGSSNRRESRWQLNCWGETYDDVTDLAAAVKAFIEEWHDVSETPGIAWARVINEFDDFDDETRTRRSLIDVILHTIGE